MRKEEHYLFREGEVDKDKLDSDDNFILISFLLLKGWHVISIKERLPDD